MSVRKCMYVIKSKPCGLRAAAGTNPPLCDKHLEELGEEDDFEEDEEDEDVGSALDEILDHPTVSGFLGRINDTIDRLASGLGGTQAPENRPPPARKRAAVEDPRMVLNFSPTDKLTPEIVKERKKQLAKVFHPDKQGSTEAMARVNAAADQLLKELSK